MPQSAAPQGANLTLALPSARDHSPTTSPANAGAKVKTTTPAIQNRRSTKPSPRMTLLDVPGRIWRQTRGRVKARRRGKSRNPPRRVAGGERSDDRRRRQHVRGAAARPRERRTIAVEAPRQQSVAADRE